MKVVCPDCGTRKDANNSGSFCPITGAAHRWTIDLGNTAYKNGATLPTDPKVRKGQPIVTGLLDYFPLAMLELAHLSKVGNDQHNLGEPLHWAREKSSDHPDCAVRHIMERGKKDIDGQRHTAKAAWRLLAMLQLELEEAAKRAES